MLSEYYLNSQLLNNYYNQYHNLSFQSGWMNLSPGLTVSIFNKNIILILEFILLLKIVSLIRYFINYVWNE